MYVFHHIDRNVINLQISEGILFSRTRPHGQGQSQTRHEQGGNLRITSESATRYLIDRSVIIFWVVIYICVNESCFTFDCWQILTDRYMSKQKRSAAAAASGDLAFPLRSFLAFLVNNTMYAYTCFLIAFVAYISIEDAFFVSGCYIIIFLSLLNYPIFYI